MEREPGKFLVVEAGESLQMKRSRRGPKRGRVQFTGIEREGGRRFVVYLDGKKEGEALEIGEGRGFEEDEARLGTIIETCCQKTKGFFFLVLDSKTLRFGLLQMGLCS